MEPILIFENKNSVNTLYLSNIEGISKERKSKNVKITLKSGQQLCIKLSDSDYIELLDIYKYQNYSKDARQYRFYECKED